MPPSQRRFRVKGVDMRRSAIGEDVDDPFGFGRKLRLARRERIQVFRSQRLLHEAAKSQRPHAQRAFGQKIATGQKVRARINRMMALGHG